jgi:2-keto-3-deoxy-L-rhamnonate aldolase RhmA
MQNTLAYESASSFPGKKPNTLRELLKAGKCTVSTRINSTWPLVTELIGNTGKFDYIEFLAEYAPVEQHDFANITRAAELHGMGSIIKVDYANRVHVAQKAVANGFQGVLFADHREAKDVEETVLSLRADCPRDGGHFGFTAARLIGYSSGFTQTQFADMIKDIVCLFMIEKKEAVDNIEEICSVKGVDMIQFGPSDFSMSSGKDARDNADAIRAAEEKCIKTAIAHGIRPRCEITNAEQAKYYLDLGVRDFSISGDLWILAAGMRKNGSELRDLLAKNALS